MEGEKSSSSRSMFSDLFGPKDQDILASIFPPKKPTSLPSWEAEKKTDSASTQPWTAKKTGEEEQSWRTNEKPTYFEEEKSLPFNYGSSIYYGGQDVFIRPKDPSPPTYNDAGEDDLESATRGNWWRGSLYY